MKKASIAVVLMVLCTPVLSFSKDTRPKYPQAVYQLIIHHDQYDAQNKLAKTIGFELGKIYSYSEYVDIKRKHKVGIAGQYDFMQLSTGGTEWDPDAYAKFIRQPCGWETTYYSNHDLTVIHEICHDQDRIRSWVRILKLGKGRHQNLYQR